MAQSQHLPAWPVTDITETLAALVACRLLSGKVGAPSELYAVPAATGASHRVPGRAGADSYEVVGTIRTRGADLEDVVTWTFEDSNCVDVRVQTILREHCSREQCSGEEEVDRLQSDDQASLREARSGGTDERNRLDSE